MPVGAVEVHGRGSPLVLLHAFPLHRGMWEAQAEDFPGHRLIAPDLPGFGEAPRQAGGLSMEGAARHVAAVLDRLGIKGPVALGGISMGGYVAFEFFRIFPERLSALILVSTRSGPDSPPAMRNRYQTADQVRTEGLGPLAEGMPGKLLGKTTLLKTAGLAERVRELILGNRDPQGIADALVAMARRRDSTPLLSRIRCPTLVLAGEEDGVIPLSEFGALARAIPGAELLALPACGHLPNLERPEAFQRAVGGFLKRLTARDS